MEILLQVLVWARRVAWHPCTLGWYRLEFKSQRAHTYLQENIYTTKINIVNRYKELEKNWISMLSCSYLF